MPEPIKIRTIEVIDESDLNKLVQEVYGRPWNLQQQGEMMSNDSLAYLEVFPNDEEVRSWPEYAAFEKWRDVPMDEPIEGPEADRYREILAEELAKDEPDENLIKWWEHYITLKPGTLEYQLYWERDYYPPQDILMGDLCERGLIPEGEYHVWVSW